MTEDVTMRTVELGDGGVIEVHLVNWTTTPDDAPVVVDLHGTPSWGRPARTTRDAATARGVRLVAPTRAGYSASSPAPGRTVGAIAADVSAVLDDLGTGRVVVVGTSGGGPHALATAAGLGDRVAAVTTVAGVGPYGADGLDFLAGMGQDNLDEFGAALAGEGQLRSYLETQRDGLDALTPEVLADSWASLLPPVDRAIVTGAMSAELVEGLRRALEPGVQGWLDDDLAFCRDWGFSLDDLGCPVSVWQGEVDLMVPAAHGRWLGRRIPGATVHLLPDEGHLSIAAGRIGDILDELLSRL